MRGYLVGRSLSRVACNTSGTRAPRGGNWRVTEGRALATGSMRVPTACGSASVGCLRSKVYPNLATCNCRSSIVGCSRICPHLCPPMPASFLLWPPSLTSQTLTAILPRPGLAIQRTLRSRRKAIVLRGQPWTPPLPQSSMDSLPG